MATYYVDASGGNDSNNGTTTGTPFLTLAKCVAVAAAGDTFNLKGTFREVDIDFRDKGDNITLQQWEGQTAAWIRGDTAVDTFTVDGGCYKKTVTTALNVATVTANWDTQINARGRHYGHLTRATSKVNCQATDNSWYYNSATGELDVRIGANADPAGYTVTYVKCSNAVSGVNGVTLGSNTATAAQGIRVLNLNWALWCWPAAGFGYPLRLFSCQNSFAKGNTYHDSGYHSLGLVNYSGAPMRNVKGIDEAAYGIVASGDSIYVAYADTGGIDVESGFENCYGLLEPFLGMDGNPIAYYSPVSPFTQVTSATAIGMACHTNAAMNISKFRAKDCLIVTGSVHSSMTNRMASYRVANAAPPSNNLNAKTYGAWFDRCDALSGVSSAHKDSMAWTNSIIQFSQAGTSGAANISNGGVLGDNSSCTAEAWMLWQACAISVDLNVGAAGASMFNCRGHTTNHYRSNLILVNCSVVNTSIYTSAQIRAFFNHIITETPTMYARGCIFMHVTPGTGSNHNNLTYNNSGITLQAQVDSMLKFKDNWYINMDTNRYSSATFCDTDAEWLAKCDTTGVFEYGVNPFLDPSGYSTLGLNNYGRNKQRFALPNCSEGINRRAYSKQYGAYQYGAPATTIPPL